MPAASKEGHVAPLCFHWPQARTWGALLQFHPDINADVEKMWRSRRT